MRVQNGWDAWVHCPAFGGLHDRFALTGQPGRVQCNANEESVPCIGPIDIFASIIRPSQTSDLANEMKDFNSR
jgi:hypothetical protein